MLLRTVHLTFLRMQKQMLLSLEVYPQHPQYYLPVVMQSEINLLLHKMRVHLSCFQRCRTRQAAQAVLMWLRPVAGCGFWMSAAASRLSFDERLQRQEDKTRREYSTGKRSDEHIVSRL
jgi:hypothetical protein